MTIRISIPTINIEIIARSLSSSSLLFGDVICKRKGIKREAMIDGSGLLLLNTFTHVKKYPDPDSHAYWTDRIQSNIDRILDKIAYEEAVDGKVRTYTLEDLNYYRAIEKDFNSPFGVGSYEVGRITATISRTTSISSDNGTTNNKTLFSVNFKRSNQNMSEERDIWDSIGRGEREKGS